MTRVDERLHAPGDVERTAGALGIVGERADLDGLRVLDLACRTGAFTFAFAAAGAQAFGLEGRAENLVQAAERQPENDAQYMLGDVRDLDPAVHGTFDVTLCLGILYHLGAEDAVKLLRAMRAVTTGFAVIDTHIGAPVDSADVDGATYQGQWYGEPPGRWSSIGNPRSFWFTPEALDDAVHGAGWTEIEHHPGIRWPGEPAGRHWLVIS